MLVKICRCRIKVQHIFKILLVYFSKFYRYANVSPQKAFSIIFLPESNLHELDLVAPDQVS